MELKILFFLFNLNKLVINILCIYGFTKLIQLETDINHFVMKACFISKYNNKKHLIAYYSKKKIA